MRNFGICESCNDKKDLVHKTKCDECFLRENQIEMFDRTTLDFTLSATVCNNADNMEKLIFDIDATEAKKILGVNSDKSLQRYRAKGLKHELRSDESTGYKETYFYNRGNLQEFKNKKVKSANQEIITSGESQIQTTLDNSLSSVVELANNFFSSDFANNFLKHFPKQKPETSIQDLAAKWFLTPSEAAKLSGLPKGWILTAIKANEIKAIEQGNKKPPLINQTDLLEWTKKFRG